MIATSISVAAGSLTAAAPASAAPVAESSLSYSIDPSSGEGDPTTGLLTEPDARFHTLRDGTVDRINVTSGDTFWSISLAAPYGETLHPGSYRDAERTGFQNGRAPGLEVIFGGGCNQVYGSFTIHQIERDSAGVISMLEASFVQRCESATAPAVRGNLKYRATPLSFRWTLTNQEPTAPGSHTYRGATSLFWAQTFWTTGVRFGASGNRRSDVVEFTPPPGERLTVGTTYRDVQPVGAQEPGHAGLAFDGFGCRPLTGTFTIRELQYGDDGEPSALWATFTLRCTEYPSPESPLTLTGTIRFHA